MKQIKPDPWETAPSKYPEGCLVVATVNNLTDFGAFAEIEPGLDGLIHVSEISSERIDRPADTLSVGQKVKAVVTKIDSEARRIGLSIKAAEERETFAAREEVETERAADEGQEPLSDFGQILSQALEKGKTKNGDS